MCVCVCVFVCVCACVFVYLTSDAVNTDPADVCTVSNPGTFAMAAVVKGDDGASVREEEEVEVKGEGLVA